MADLRTRRARGDEQAVSGKGGDGEGRCQGQERATVPISSCYFSFVSLSPAGLGPTTNIDEPEKKVPVQSNLFIYLCPYPQSPDNKKAQSCN